MPPSLVPRVAFFPDSFHEVNGVAHTARQFTAWAAQTGRPFLCIRAGGTEASHTKRGFVEVLELPRGSASFPLDKDLRYDPLFIRHTPAILRALRAFRPDVIHITGPSELGMLGAALAHYLGIPLAASWHTNVHEYAAQRAKWALQLLPAKQRSRGAHAIMRLAFRAAALFYRAARVLFAPNPELCHLLEKATGRRCLLMMRGIDANLFSPSRRTAPPLREGTTWTLGYVGRLSVEKNITLLAAIAKDLRRSGLTNFRFLIVGQGAEEASLRAALPEAVFTGVLRGEALAAAYADMDCFLFPSHTDTFGNVVLEAMASGVPAIVTPDGGPAHLVRDSICDGHAGGLICNDREFTAGVLSVMGNQTVHTAMQRSARNYAARASWDAVFSGVYRGYEQALTRK